MEQKLKICSACGVPSKLWRSTPKLCKPCAMKADAKDKPKQTKALRPSIKPVSDKQAKLNKAYMVLRNVHLKNHPYCAVNHYCHFGEYATDVHHKKGRGEYLLDSSTYLSVCRECHNWLEANSTIAKDLGFSENRLSK